MAEEKRQKGEREGQSHDLQEVRGKNPLLLIVLLLNTFCMAAIGYFQYQAHKKEQERPSVHDIVQSAMGRRGQGQAFGFLDDGSISKKQEGNEDGILLPLNGFTVNLAQGEGPRRFIRLNTVLKFGLDSDESEFRSRRPQIRDSIISILNSKKPGDLLRKEGKEYLKEEIKASINSFLVNGKVVAVYYVGFQIN